MMEPEYYIFTGRGGVPGLVTHVLIDNALKFVPARAFWCHPYIQEVICHDGVERIEECAFLRCPSLSRVIMPGVKYIEERAFDCCGTLAYIECGKLRRIGDSAFHGCNSLRSFDLPFIQLVGGHAFSYCKNLISVNFGKDLESLGRRAFLFCDSLECIPLPLKDGLIADDVFRGCDKLEHVDLVGGVHETIAALLLEEWKNDMNEEIDSINRILLSSRSGGMWEHDPGEKSQAVRMWLQSILRKIIHYKAEHRRILNEAATTLQPSLPNDIVLKNVLPFLKMPSYTFEGEI